MYGGGRRGSTVLNSEPISTRGTAPRSRLAEHDEHDGRKPLAVLRLLTSAA